MYCDLQLLNHADRSFLLAMSHLHRSIHTYPAVLSSYHTVDRPVPQDRLQKTVIVVEEEEEVQALRKCWASEEVLT